MREKFYTILLIKNDYIHFRFQISNHFWQNNLNQNIVKFCERTHCFHAS